MATALTKLAEQQALAILQAFDATLGLTLNLGHVPQLTDDEYLVTCEGEPTDFTIRIVTEGSAYAVKEWRPSDDATMHHDEAATLTAAAQLVVEAMKARDYEQGADAPVREGR